VRVLTDLRQGVDAADGAVTRRLFAIAVVLLATAFAALFFLILVVALPIAFVCAVVSGELPTQLAPKKE
jgi:hypothetical protein